MLSLLPMAIGEGTFSLVVGGLPISVFSRLLPSALTEDGFTFEGLASFADYDPADLAGPVRMKDQELTGRINRRVQKWCPRGDSPARHGNLLRSLSLPFSGAVTVPRRSRVA
jgi:hypothetical protein